MPIVTLSPSELLLHEMGSVESHFNVSLIHNNCEGHSHRTQTTTFEEKGEPMRIRTNVPLLTARPRGS